MPHEHHDGCGHEHDHSHDQEGGPGDNLFSRIDLQNVTVLNSESPASNAIKPWHSRMDEIESLSIVSDADDQLIIRVPFTGSVKLRSILLRSGPQSHTPTRICLFPNRDQLDFDDVSSVTPVQEFEVAQSSEIGEYTAKAAKFSSVRSLTIFVPSAQGADVTRISYLGFTGEFRELKEQPVITVYETQANLADHPKIQGTDGAFSAPGT